ncbi:protein of unknown function [Amycolatopsis xylanica]|uniref:Uncharacterized protein n=1 Tax=Amycolatopsis xylanica TaxID=589385 RepID=A0A1H3NQ96_9PSEU|nr:ImmA/IrrE family metallo-endopeptidase [Amycolatopsis xylanica]SDY91081.1 protein of unknown function [Amycolatopsis xylanica]
MTSRRLKKHCRSIVRGVGLPQPFSVARLCHKLSAQRGRPLYLLPFPVLPTAGGPCGLWIATAESDYIFYEENTTKLHQEHIIVHEIAHMLCEHESPGLTEPSSFRAILPDLDPALVRRLLARTSYTNRQEEEAEMVASLILDHATRCAGPSTPDLARLEQVLGTRPSDA